MLDTLVIPYGMGSTATQTTGSMSELHPRTPSKKPKRAEVRVQRAQVIYLGNLPITEPKGRDVHDAQTTVYTEA